MLTRLQILRAFAAYAVVMHHWGAAIASTTGFEIPGNHLGPAGVDLFFVISGFVMVHVAGRRDGPGRFMFDRVVRIVPLYWFATLAALLAISIRPWTFSGSLVTPETIVSSFLFIPAHDNMDRFMPILSVGWSLNFEMMFYALFAIAMFAPHAWRVLIVLGLMALLFVAGSLAPDGHPFSCYGDPILFEFAMGCVIGWWVADPARLALAARIPGWLWIAADAALFVANATVLGPFDNRMISYGVPAMLIVLGIVVLDLTQPKPAKGLLVSLGDASYSAYLLHLFVVLAGMLTILPLIGAQPVLLALTYPVIIAVTALVSALSYKVLEIPSRDFLRRLLPPKRTTAAESTG